MSKATDKSASDKSPSASPCAFQSDTGCTNLQWTSRLTSHCKGGEQQCHEYFCHTVLDKYWNKEHGRLVPTYVFFSQRSNISTSLINLQITEEICTNFFCKRPQSTKCRLKSHLISVPTSSVA